MDQNNLLEASTQAFKTPLLDLSAADVEKSLIEDSVILMFDVVNE